MPARRKPVRKAVRRKAAPKKKVARKVAATPALTPSAIGAMNHHLDYTTHDIEGVKRFYTHLLGFSKFNEDPKFNYLWIQTGHTSSLGFMPPMREMGEPSPAKEPVLYFMVKDVDRAYT